MNSADIKAATADLADDILQKVDWRVRLTEALVERKFDVETLSELLHAGLAQAHQEGLRDAAEIAGQIARRVPASAEAKAIEKGLRALMALNARPSE